MKGLGEVVREVLVRAHDVFWQVGLLRVTRHERRPPLTLEISKFLRYFSDISHEGGLSCGNTTCGSCRLQTMLLLVCVDSTAQRGKSRLSTAAALTRTRTRKHTTHTTTSTHDRPPPTTTQHACTGLNSRRAQLTISGEVPRPFHVSDDHRHQSLSTCTLVPLKTSE